MQYIVNNYSKKNKIKNIFLTIKILIFYSNIDIIYKTELNKK